MNLLADLEQFHFLRPALLWLLLPAALACWALARTVFNSGQLQKLVDADLLPHLLLRGGARRPLLFMLIFFLLAGMIVALAGPSWRKLPTPVFSNQDALVILLDLSPSMMATDLSPDRLTRARLKILDILKERKDGLTAMVAYGGEAHVVTPLTEDTATIANLVPALSPGIVPVPGSNIEMAVEAAIRLLQDGASGRGRILAVTDGIADEALGTVAGLTDPAAIEFSVLAVGSGEGSPIPRGNSGGFVTDGNGAIVIAGYDAGQLRKLARRGGGRFSQITVDDRDISYLLEQAGTPEQATETEREFDQWREEGPWLVLLLLPLAALLFRRGALACALPLAVSLLLPQPSRADEASGIWDDLWLRDDQQARRLLQQGAPERAAKLFEDPQWRGTAKYRAEDFPSAAKLFSRGANADSLYNLGNSLTRQGRYDEAIAAYGQALARQPQFPDAEHNREIARKLKELQQQKQQQQQSQQGQKQQQEQQGQKEQQQGAQQPGEQQDEDQSGSQTGQSPQQEQQDGSEAQDGAEQQQQGAQAGEEAETDGEGKAGEQADRQQAPNENALDPETQQALDQWLRQIPDDPAGLMREKFKYESLQRRREYRTGEWKPPENGASQRW
ncbi:VWA domain-containing protein [Microbulbifer yueqingensis]|uniref:Ca-activated chloride channel family protein n=1 Tax=Microbulbifer yueqingensis TaxID=658219 RepID=A0A1G9A8V5_9GAMM|nr:VWA domain-containing protein [Microbulbifer yueqingensis]SDK23792.1 Ca-activated chloride channel family protein [Microbulbifer yueqingensis]